MSAWDLAGAVIWSMVAVGILRALAAEPFQDGLNDQIPHPPLFEPKEASSDVL